MTRMREWNIWTWDIFFDTRDSKGDRIFKRVIWVLIPAFVVGLTFTLLTVPMDEYTPAVVGGWLWWLMVPILTTAFVAPSLGKLNPLYGIPDHSYEYNLVSRGKEYLRLDNADRARYPSNILKMLKDPDLTHVQRRQLDQSLQELYLDIDKRNKARAALVKRTPDIAETLDQISNARTVLKEDIKTYQEA